MKPRGPLMIEHRLIEKMLRVIGKEAEKIKEKKLIDPVFIDTAVDFIRTYADRTHHGKEEDILFRDLEKKKMSPENTRMMQELIDEHSYARKTVAELVEAKSKYLKGEKSALGAVLDKLTALIMFYPGHIKKEDDEFFPNTERYFTPAELDNLLNEFWEFDRAMIHEKYRKLVKELEAR
jgi:hemerythrin-like domain-containing protein